MSDESFLLVSLDEEKSKELAQVLSNETARKILNYLSKIEHATETEISKKLNIPLSTVHYNLSLLVKSNLVNDEHYSYSEKGKEIIHYSLSNKYVIIAPKNSEQLKEKLKKYLPVALISGIITLCLKNYNYIRDSFSNFFTTNIKQEVQTMSLKSVSYTQESQDFSFWFLIGSLVTLFVYFIWTEIILKKLYKKK